MRPVPDVVRLRHLQHHVADRLAGEEALAGVLVGSEDVPAAIAQRKARSVGGEVGAEVVGRLDAVHRQSRGVGVGQRAIDLNHQDAIVERADDAQELRAVGPAGE